ncbi:hypothetical protein GCM10009676_03190 [Prauserella halophila]|uniref:Uncharacterized protein n=1 Tax=Prauserella halophila TaxID=185641 RepID=A0ABN1VWS4_9PSEU|nr:hypothetical protein [Prauserella halophila]
MRYSVRCPGGARPAPAAVTSPAGYPARAGFPHLTGPEIVVAVSEPERESRT